MTTSQPSDFSQEQEREKMIQLDRRSLGVGVGMFVLIVGLVGGVGYLNNSQITNTQMANKKTEITTEIPKESQKPAEEVQSYTVLILNGSGVTGAAGKAGESVRQAGGSAQWDISTGNAPSQTGNSVTYRSEQLRRGVLMGVISELYPEARVRIDEQQESDAVVILGK